MTHEQLHALWKMVQDFRTEMRPYFPTPNESDSLAFALTEIAEAVDAQLRQNPVYKRNNQKAHTVERELAQCAMMLLTSMADFEPPQRQSGMDGEQRLASIAVNVAEAYSYPLYITYRWQAITRIATLIDLPAELSAELDRMRAKHKPDDGPSSLNEVANEHVICTPERGIAYPITHEELRLADYTEGMEQ